MDGAAERVPLVSLVIRSVGRPCLRDAIACVAAQTHRPLELVVVDATGGRHPALPPLPGIEVRLVTPDRPLNRPAAANAGVAAATGTWIAFLDDDDLVGPLHVERLLARAGEADLPLLVYAQHWTIDRFHRVVDQRHHAFNPLILQYYCRIPGMGCLVHRSLLARQRFDESLPTCEDWDLWLRLLPLARFATVPVPTHLYFLESGTSGTGVGRNRTDSPATRDDRARVLARHAATRAATWQRYLADLGRGAEVRGQEGTAGALAYYAAMLDRHPDEPNALCLLAQAHGEEGRLHTARRLCRQSIFFNGDARDTYRVLAAVCDALGYAEEATEARVLAGDTASHPATAAGGGASRNARCACGSGRRYKSCHGATGRGATAVPASPALLAGERESVAAAARSAMRVDVDAMLAAADAALACGDHGTAARTYSEVLARAPQDVEALHGSALLAWDVGDYALADARLVAAARHAPGDAQVADNLARVRDERRERRIARECLRDVHALVAELPPLAFVPRMHDEPVHVVAGFDERDGPGESHALELARILAAHAPVCLWSTAAHVSAPLLALGVQPLDAAHGPQPARGTLVLCAPLLVPPWLARFAASRVVVDADGADPPLLLDLLHTLVARFPGRLRVVLRDGGGVEHSVPNVPALARFRPGHVDLARFQPAPTLLSRPFTLGCVLDPALGSHPGDAMLFRGLAADGIGIRVLGGDVLLRHFPPSRRQRGITLLAHGEADRATFLQGLDCLLHRAAPRRTPAPSVAIVQALASGVPVITMRSDPAARLVTHGHDGFLLDSAEDVEARGYVRRLRRSPSLRERMRRAARATAERWLDARTHAALRECYLGCAAAAIDPPSPLSLQPA